MSLSVLEVLENAKYNLEYGTMAFQKQVAIQQLRNAINQLEKNPDADAVFNESDVEVEVP